jgi:phosphoribosylanthranilate isomerase
MRIGVKICGVTSPVAIEAAAQAGADAVGFVFAPSPRRLSLSPHEAARLARRVPPTLLRVAVFGSVVPVGVRELTKLLALDMVQADAEACDRLDGLVPAAQRLPVFHDTPAAAPLLEEFLGRSPGERPLLLFEGSVSGQGVLPDWGRAARVSRRARLVLAGGLTPENVGAAILAVRPAMVDVSSGVESAPGVKDERRIRAFVMAVREAEERLAESEGERT